MEQKITTKEIEFSKVEEHWNKLISKVKSKFRGVRENEKKMGSIRSMEFSIPMKSLSSLMTTGVVDGEHVASPLVDEINKVASRHKLKVKGIRLEKGKSPWLAMHLTRI